MFGLDNLNGASNASSELEVSLMPSYTIRPTLMYYALLSYYTAKQSFQSAKRYTATGPCLHPSDNDIWGAGRISHSYGNSLSCV
jgi:hypothetical protein